jgi:PadR family transcriptional regulator, regulatory protein AphA
MEFSITQVNGIRFLECNMDGGVINDEAEALDLVALCGENQVDTVLLQTQNLAPGFFDLKTGIAGRIMLKLSNYKIRVAAVLPSDTTNQGRFYEMVLETNRGNQFRVFAKYADAMEWIKTINT